MYNTLIEVKRYDAINSYQISHKIHACIEHFLKYMNLLQILAKPTRFTIF